MHGHYSQKQSNNSKFNIIYKTKDGKTVIVTEVTKTPKPDGNFDDYEYVGELDKFVRTEEKQNESILTSMLAHMKYTYNDLNGGNNQQPQQQPDMYSNNANARFHDQHLQSSGSDAQHQHQDTDMTDDSGDTN